MFKNLSTSTKLFILCGMFIAALCVTTYSLVMEKRIAIEFARKELVGLRYLATIREIYDAVLLGLVGESKGLENLTEVQDALTSAEARAGGRLETAELQQVLAARLTALSSGDGRDSDQNTLDALAAARALAVRVGEDFEPDPRSGSRHLLLAGYCRLEDPPAHRLSGRVGDPHREGRAGGSGGERGRDSPACRPGADRIDAAGHRRRPFGRLSGEYRRNAQGRGRRPVRDDDHRGGLLRRERSGGACRRGGQWLPHPARSPISTPSTAGALPGPPTFPSSTGFSTAASTGFSAGSMAASSSPASSARSPSSSPLLTHRHIVTPLQRFESVAKTVSETKDYSLRVEVDSRDEIGRLAVTFNEMLAELAEAREREMSEQTELARVTRLTTMGAMTASIAHEINQPLAAIVTNSSAAMRWLATRRARPRRGPRRADSASPATAIAPAR